MCPRDATRGIENVDLPPTARATSCYGAETLRGKSLRCIENLRLLIVFCLGPFWYTQQLYFDSRFRLYISHGTDTIMTEYDTGRTKIPFGPFDVCIWVSHFLVQDSPIEVPLIRAHPAAYLPFFCIVCIWVSHFLVQDSPIEVPLIRAHPVAYLPRH
jgi:hypothetical protein